MNEHLSSSNHAHTYLFKDSIYRISHVVMLNNNIQLLRIGKQFTKRRL